METELNTVSDFKTNTVLDPESHTIWDPGNQQTVLDPIASQYQILKTDHFLILKAIQFKFEI